MSRKCRVILQTVREFTIREPIPAAVMAEAINGTNGDQLTRQQVAKRLGMSVSLVDELNRAGELPAVRRGRYVTFKPSDVEAWIEAHTERGAA